MTFTALTSSQSVVIYFQRPAEMQDFIEKTLPEKIEITLGDNMLNFTCRPQYTQRLLEMIKYADTPD